MSDLIGAKLHVIKKKGNQARRYFSCVVASLSIIWKEKPDILFVQNPSIVLNYLALALRPVFGFTLVSDAHFTGVVAHGGNFALQKLLDSMSRVANLVIAMNENHANHISTIGGSPYVCEDPLPKMPPTMRRIDQDRGNPSFSFAPSKLTSHIAMYMPQLQSLNAMDISIGGFQEGGNRSGRISACKISWMLTYDVYFSFLTNSSKTGGRRDLGKGSFENHGL